MLSPTNRLKYLLNDLKSIKEYINTLERCLEEEARRYAASLKTDNKELANRFDNKVDLAFSLNHLFPSIHRRSTLVTIFSHVEFRLLQLCDDVIEHDKLDFEFQENKSESGIDQAKDFINKHTRYNFPSDSQNWQHIKRVQKIRNLIIHKQGVIPKENTDLENFILSNEYLSFRIAGIRKWIIIEPLFLNNFLEILEKLFTTFLNDIRKVQNA